MFNWILSCVISLGCGTFMDISVYEGFCMTCLFGIFLNTVSK